MKYVKTFEQHSLSTNDVVNEELFGIGKKTYNLSTFKASEATEAFFAKRNDLVKGGNFRNSQGKVSKVEGYINTFKRLGVPEDLAENAAKALIEFAGAHVDEKNPQGKDIPAMAKYTYTFDTDKKELVIDPNGKGLFNGHPIMG